jgi:hypothetical protein
MEGGRGKGSREREERGRLSDVGTLKLREIIVKPQFLLDVMV